MTPYTDLLPPTKSDPKGQTGFDWERSESEGPAAGVLTIKQKRIYVSYVVVEFPVEWAGRGFHLSKLTEGSDPAEDGYDVFVAKDSPHRFCPCKGFTYAHSCKHTLALVALIANGKL